MAQSPADSRKENPENQPTVAAYTLLKIVLDTLKVNESKQEREANRAPVETQINSKELNKSVLGFFLCIFFLGQTETRSVFAGTLLSANTIQPSGS